MCRAYLEKPRKTSAKSNLHIYTFDQYFRVAASVYKSLMEKTTLVRLKLTAVSDIELHLDCKYCTVDVYFLSR